MHENTALSNAAQLDVFTRGIDTEFDVTEELATSVPMKESTTSADFYGKKSTNWHAG